MAQQQNLHVNVRFSSIEDKEKVIEFAMKCGYATHKQTGASRYMKALALGYSPKSLFDKKIVVEIGKLHTDLGRVGGLIKKAIEDGLIGNEFYGHIGELLSTRREIGSLVVDISEGKYKEQ